METMNTSPASAGSQKGSGKKFLLGVLVIGIVLLIFFFMLLKSPVQAPEQDVVPIIPPAPEEPLSSSDAVSALENDLSGTELEGLDSELHLIEGEL